MKTDLITQMVQTSLHEDLGSGDITASLIPEQQQAYATLTAKEDGILCGISWFNCTYISLNQHTMIEWHASEGDEIHVGQILATLHGNTRTLLMAERTALNWLQTLSGTATQTHRFLKQLSGTKTQLRDTRKTIPGLRYAQKYAVTIGGGKNHRMGLYDAFLIKENHIMACKTITNAITQAKFQCPNQPIEIEVENLEQLTEAIAVRADIILLDNFSMPLIKQAVVINQGQSKLEVSGNVNIHNIHDFAMTGIDYIAVGALTKHLHAIDLSMHIY